MDDEYFPLITKEILIKVDARWYDHTIAALHRQRRRAECRWRRLRSDPSQQEYVVARRVVIEQDLHCKMDYYRDQWISCGGGSEESFFFTQELIG